MSSKTTPIKNPRSFLMFLSLFPLSFFLLANNSTSGDSEFIQSDLYNAPNLAATALMPPAPKPYPGCVFSGYGGESFCFGINQGYTKYNSPPYTNDLKTPLNFFIEKLGAYMGDANIENHYAVTTEVDVGSNDIIELGVKTTPDSANRKYVYWYLNGPGYLNHCDQDRVGGPSSFQIWLSLYNSTHTKIVADDNAFVLYGELQADAFMDRYLLPYADNNKQYKLWEYFTGNAIFVDFENPITGIDGENAQAANCSGWGNIGIGQAIDPTNPEHYDAIDTQWKRNKLVFNSFLGRLRLRLNAAYQAGQIGDKNIGLYTRRTLLSGSDQILSPGYRFPEKMVLWLAENPRIKGTSKCLLSDSHLGNDLINFHPMDVDPLLTIAHVSHEISTGTGYGIFSGDTKWRVRDLIPVIWQYCNDFDVTTQNPDKGFTPTTIAGYKPDSQPFPVQLQCAGLPAGSQGTCSVDSSKCKVSAHLTTNANCGALEKPYMNMPVNCTGIDCAQRVAYKTKSSGLIKFSSSYPRLDLIPRYILYMVSHGIQSTPFVQNVVLDGIEITASGIEYRFGATQSLPGSWQNPSLGIYQGNVSVELSTYPLCHSIINYYFDVTFEAWVEGCPVIPGPVASKTPLPPTVTAGGPQK